MIRRMLWIGLLLIGIGNLNEVGLITAASAQEDWDCPSGWDTGDCETLQELYLSTNGANWTTNMNWGTVTEPWFGVTVNDDGHVIQLDLTSYQLQGSLPESLGNLSQLQLLYLGRNRLSGSIPESLGNLSQLTRLVLSNNALSGSIPASLGNLSQLRTLYLADNELSGHIPASLGNLSELWSLSLSYNQLDGEIPPELGDLPSINRVFLGNNHLGGTLPDWMAGYVANDTVRPLYLLVNNNCGLVAPNSAVQSFVENNDPGWMDTQTNCES